MKLEPYLLFMWALSFGVFLALALVWAKRGNFSMIILMGIMCVIAYLMTWKAAEIIK